MAKKPLPTPDVIRQLLDYDPETGKLTWKARTPEIFAAGKYTPEQSCRRWNTKYASKPAFTADNGIGYRVGSIFKNLLRAHRVAWAIHYGRWPEADLDHINGDRSDNRIANLREATHAENMQNVTLQSRNTSGFHGVNWDASRGKWLARISLNNRTRNLGYFSSAEEASAAYQEAKKRLHTFNPTVRR